METNKGYILKLALEHNVTFVKLWFTDTLGLLKSFTITVDELEDALDQEIGDADASTVGGWVMAHRWRRLLEMPKERLPMFAPPA